MRPRFSKLISVLTLGTTLIFSLTCSASNLIALSKSKDISVEEKKHMKFEIHSSAFQPGERIPVVYTADGQDVSPLLKWKLPENARSAALICDDPDAPMGTWVHWVIYNIPPATEELKEGISKDMHLPDGSLQGKNSWSKVGYNGPDPPSGKIHHYHFKLYALNEPIQLSAGATKEQLIAAMQGHVLAQAELVGVYGR
jgi:Raf kinase inhibitor-like YbhB/YbcL family protein